MLKKFVKIFGGDPNKRQIQQLAQIADAINELEPQFEALSDEALRAKTDEFRRRLALGETLDDILVEAFAVVREASKRTIGLRHYDIQLVGGIVLHQGKIAEMRTGEGKTLVATLPLYLNALTLNPDWIELAREKWGDHPDKWQFVPLEDIPVGRGVHLVTVNDYLARRDARWKAPIYNMLGLSVGVLQMAARTDHGRLAFLVDLDKESPHEDQHQLLSVPRKQAYAADITYGTTNEFGFDYLRDNMKLSLEERVQRGHYYAIIDEVDNVLIDEARTPLIISGPSHDDAEHYIRMAQVVKQLRPEDYEVDERSRTVALTEIGEIHVEQILGEPLRDPDRPEDITPEQARMLGYLEQALRAQFVFKRNKDYLVQGGKVIIIDENTGRLMPGRRWSDGLHQAVEAKEGVKVQSENVTYATITIQNYYRMYEKLAGMTGTAATEAEEFHKIYELEVLEIPTNLDYQASHPDWPLIARQAVDEEGYKYTYYVHEDNPDGPPLFFKRKDYPDVVYRTEEAKFRAIGKEILRYHTLGRPILVGTTSVELSERLSSRLKADPIRKLAQVLLLRHKWMEAHNREVDGRAIPELEFLNRPLGLLPAKKMREMARQLKLNLNPLTSDNLDTLIEILGLSPEHKERLALVLKNGIPHQVLNARKHTEESQIIAGAGAFGAVTIATNMAGRGVDIKLGGELPEAIISQVNRVLKRAGHQDPYDMSMEEKETALLEMDRSQYGIYEDAIERFLQFMKESRLVKELGGLHVIGSERHESRRIDNQLRGRAARQGDPGSSRFYLSMQDNLMRLFGGQQAENMMARLNIDDDMPIEMGLVSRIVEQSQTRVEGANFDTRKHLLEYDDVLNKQRATIYSQRDRIFTKDDLSEDVLEMLETEVRRRVPEALANEEGPWKLLAWLDATQPPVAIGNAVFPSFTLQLLLDHIKDTLTTGAQSTLHALLDLAAKALDAEEEHLLNTIDRLLGSALKQVEAQIDERLDMLDVFMEGLAMEDEEEESRTPRQIEEELTGLLRAPIKLDYELRRALRDDPDAAADAIQNQVETFLASANMRRIIAVAERGLRESLDMRPKSLTLDEWDEYGDQVLEAIRNVYAARRKRLLGENQDGVIARDLKNTLSQIKDPLTDAHLLNLLSRMPQGQRATFDRKTKQRVWRRTIRLTYTHYAARLLEDRDEEELTEEILTHLQNAQQAIQRGLGAREFARLGNTPIANLSKPVREGLRRAFGEDVYAQVANQPLTQLPSDQVNVAIDELGRQILTLTYRHLLLRVIGDLWVEYLTQMEALRVSVGLEAYAQRDPLVTYKAKASELFQNLIANTRMGVVSRMFTYQLPKLTLTADGKGTTEQPPTPQQAASEAEPLSQQPDRQPEPVGVGPDQGTPVSRSAKRRRRRRRKK